MKINDSRRLYNVITKENFPIIKEILLDGIKTKKDPLEISREITKKTGIPETICLGFVNREINGAKFI